MTILSIGRSSYNITCPVDEYPVEGTKYLLNEKIECGGGTAANVSFLLGRWGESVYLASVAGSDDYGSKLRKELEQATVRTELMETSYETGTPLSITLVNKKKGSRTKFDVVAQNHPLLKKYDYPITPNVIFSDGKEYAATINALNKYPNAVSIVDAGRVSKDLLELCKFVKYIICSKSFAENVSGLKIDYNNSASLVNVYKKLKQRYPNNNVIVTLGEMGAMYTVEGEIRIMPGIKATVVDPSGSGDIFNGAFVYCIANNFDVEKSVTYANIAAGLSVGKMGARTSIPTIKEVIAYYNAKFRVEGQEEEIQVRKDEPEVRLPEIPNAATFRIPEFSATEVPLESTFTIGGSSIPVVSPDNNVQQ